MKGTVQVGDKPTGLFLNESKVDEVKAKNEFLISL